MLGVLQWCCGSIFYELLEAIYWGAPPGGRWQARWAYQLAIAYSQFVAWCRQNSVKTSQPEFTLARISVSALKDRPLFKCKAANGYKVSRWLAEVCATVDSRSPTAHSAARAGTIFGYVQAVETCKHSAIFLSDSEGDKLEQCRRCALQCHAFLAHESHGNGRSNLWITKPKHHLFDECCRRTCKERLNPVNHWAFADEDFCGRVVAIAQYVGGMRRSEAILKRYLLRIHCQLHSFASAIPG